LNFIIIFSKCWAGVYQNVASFSPSCRSLNVKLNAHSVIFDGQLRALSAKKEGLSLGILLLLKGESRLPHQDV
jgi:hypothetical protein